ncbi:Nicotinamide N-methyltransferase-like [Chlorella sorokiniana]|uniref:Nicotinamide N-methyltransferase-like n=1 Tax=Chlorella sorokiniana TaxID=3076 RepID=A0A2P6TYV7_CHLSO|nr:Nicotinamide N-methyltransferase-like [Chlorella sorokiniana]|eukprot:PRW59248.1 Nicotinamide N-methyltransferase-like [Chlorella sorokiniana]
MADEGDFITLLVASERVGAWCDVLRLYLAQVGSLPRVKQAVRDLRAALDSEAYAEEARREGAVPLLTSLLKRTDDEELLNDISDALAACSGLLASGGKIRTFAYGGTPVVLKEGALGDGVGAKVWTVAHTFCREMASHPDIVRGCSVLEIGAGCGACGILAAKLDAQRVVLGDYVGAVLQNLRDCVHLNAAGSSGEAAAAAGAAERRQQEEAAEAADDTDWDPEDASECGSDDFDTLLAEAAGRGGSGSGDQQQQRQQATAAWDAGAMHVRFHDWQHDVDCLSEDERAALAATPGVPASTEVPPGASIDTASNECGAPGMDAEEQFDVVIGTDILYEWPMVQMVPAVLKRRLRPGGRALLCCAVREQAMFDGFAAACRSALGMRVGITPVQPRADDAGLLDIRQDYEGGYVLIAVEHAHAPASDWHRDLFAGSA